MQSPSYHNYVSNTEEYLQNKPAPKKTRVVLNSKDVLGDNNVDLKKMLGILIILIIVVFFTVLIGIVVTLMKTSNCRCNANGFNAFAPPFYHGLGAPGSMPGVNNLPFV
jgi:hypothetical protein